MIAVYVVAGVVFVLLIALLVSYNRFVNQRNLIRNSWANIDTELRRRYDLIPNLVETVRGYATHERGVMEAVVEARQAAVAATGAVDEQARAERTLVTALRGVIAVAENYPALRANELYLNLMEELANTEDRLAAARRFYNGNVRDFNRRVQSVPSNLVAGMFKFVESEYFEVEEAIRSSRVEARP